MKKIIPMLFLLLLLGCAFQEKNPETQNDPSSTYCGEESESTCGIRGPADMSDYENFTDESNVFINSDMAEAIRIFENKESAVLYFGYPACPWCIEALPIMNETAKEKDITILYIQTRDADRNQLYTDEEKAQILKYVGEFEETDEDGNLGLYVPLVVVVKDGVAIQGHVGTVDGHDAHERKMTEDEQKELKQIYEDMFSK